MWGISAPPTTTPELFQEESLCRSAVFIGTCEATLLCPAPQSVQNRPIFPIFWCPPARWEYLLALSSVLHLEPANPCMGFPIRANSKVIGLGLQSEPPVSPAQVPPWPGGVTKEH